MPETIRATGRRLRARLLRQGFTAGSVAVIAALTGIAPARADGPSLGANLETVDLYLAAFAALDRHEIVTLVLMLGILFFAVTSSVMLVRTRVRNAAAQAAYRDEIIRLKGAGDRLSALLFSERQILVSWAAASDAPVIMGDTSLVTDAAMPQRVLAFGSWLDPDKAQAMERAVDELRAEGTSFSMQVMTLADQAIEAEGRAGGALEADAHLVVAGDAERRFGFKVVEQLRDRVPGLRLWIGGPVAGFKAQLRQIGRAHV